MRRIKGVSNIVLEVLQEVPEARNCDDLLYYKVCEKLNPDYMSYPFCQIMQNVRRYGFPSYKSVERARRKIQRAFPQLSATKVIEDFRTENEMTYREYARSVNV